MQVYLEDVFIDNFIIDFILLYATSRIMGLGTKKWVIALVATLGVALVVVNLAVRLGGAWLFCYKMCCGALMVLLILKQPSFSKFMLSFLTFICLTFVVGGACLVISMQFAAARVLETGEAAYTLALPMGVVVGVAFLLLRCAIKLVVALKKRLAKLQFTYAATIKNNGKCLQISAFVDTGNCVFDPLCNKPITFIAFKQFRKVFKEVPLADIVLQKPCSALNGAHYVRVGTISGKTQKVMVFCVEELQVWQNGKAITISNAPIGVTFAQLDKSLSCGMIISPQLLIGGKYE